jgi:hypothetical protein
MVTFFSKTIESYEELMNYFYNNIDVFYYRYDMYGQKEKVKLEINVENLNELFNNSKLTLEIVVDLNKDIILGKEIISSEF